MFWFGLLVALAGADARSLSHYAEKAAGSYAWVDGPAQVRNRPNGRILFSVPDGAEVRLIRAAGSWWEIEHARKRGLTHAKNIRPLQVRLREGRFESLEVSGTKITEKIGDRSWKEVGLHPLEHTRYFVLAEFPAWEQGAGALVAVARKGEPLYLHGENVRGIGARLGGVRIEGPEVRFRADFGCAHAPLEYRFEIRRALDQGRLPSRFEVIGRPSFLAAGEYKSERLRIAAGERYSILAWDTERRAFEIQSATGERAWAGHEELELLAPTASDMPGVLKRYCAG